jgi:hypothetical protein
MHTLYLNIQEDMKFPKVISAKLDSAQFVSLETDP